MPFVSRVLAGCLPLPTASFGLEEIPMKALEDCHLYTFIDMSYLNSRKPEVIARQLCEGGSDLIQLRAKNSSLDEVCRMAEGILPIAEEFGVGLVINDHWQIALQTGAPLCHLGQEDFFGAGRTDRGQLLPREVSLKLGLSTHAPPEAERAIKAGADYVAIGPVYATGTKPGAKPVTLDYVRWAASHVRIPWFAIGGIHLGNVDQVLEAGARRICAVSAILNAPDIVRACQQLKDRLSSAARNP